MRLEEVVSDTSVAYCCVMHNEEDIVFWQLAYYYQVGIRDFFITLNTADDLTPTLINAFGEAHHDANLHVSRDEDRSYENFPARKNALYQKAGSAGFDWILPVDADELITTQDPTLRPTLHLPTFLSEHFSHVKPNQGLRFPCYNFHPTAEDDWLNANPFERITQRTPSLTMGKVIWRYGAATNIFRGQHSIINGEHVRGGPRPMTAHYPLRTPLQVISKLHAFGQCATHHYDDTIIESPSVPPCVSYDPGTHFTGQDTERSLNHQHAKANGLTILLDLHDATRTLKEKASQNLVTDTVWKDTFANV